jgi:hypothetical protein
MMKGYRRTAVRPYTLLDFAGYAMVAGSVCQKNPSLAGIGIRAKHTLTLVPSMYTIKQEKESNIFKIDSGLPAAALF